MLWFAKILFSGVCAVITFLCAVALSDLALGIRHGAVLDAALNPFIFIGLVDYAYHALLFSCLLFGVWAVFFPPRHAWRRIVFYLAAVGAGTWASYSYQLFEWPEYPFQAGMLHIPPTFHLASVTTVACFAVALASAAACSFVGRALLRALPPNHAMERTADRRTPQS
jgi:hypothetical protein